MNIYNYLRKDHAMVSDLMEQIKQSQSPQERKRLFETMAEELLLHAKTEASTFYTALETRGGKQLQEDEMHAEEEHDEIESLIKELRALDPADSQWLITFGSLKQAVEHHVDEEENQIFQKARKVIPKTEAEKLAEQMDMLKRKEGRPALRA